MKNYFDIDLSSDEIMNISSLGLAYIGDAVYELITRLYLCQNGAKFAGNMHEAAIARVSAHSQAKAFKIIESRLTEDEIAIYMRGRNAHPKSTPKNVSRSEYHCATGFEALFGYLYITKQTDRINELYDLINNEVDHD